MTSAYAAAVLVAVLATPFAREALERVMALHMLVQIPLLAIAGALGAAALPASFKTRIAQWNNGGVSGALLGLIVSSWWMVPRALDWSLQSPAMEVIKFGTLPLLVGAPLKLSWGPLGTIGRGFVIANVLPMWAVVGWAYVAAPVRLCNYYLLDQQAITGVGLMIASLALGVASGLFAFRAQPAGTRHPQWPAVA